MTPRDSATSAPSTGFEFRVLGTLEVLRAGVGLTPGSSGTCAVLAGLLLEPNRVVSMDRIVDTLWDERPPPTARTIVHGYVSRIRKLFAAGDAAVPGQGPPELVTRAPGYLLRVDAERIDAHRARALVNHALGLGAADRSRVLSQALTLWRGPVLADIASARLHRMAAPSLDELRLLALEERADADLELGEHRNLVAELSTLVDENPLRERLTGQLMLACYRAGRRAEAQARYHALRERLSDELGIDPGPELRALYERLLRDDETLLGRHRNTATMPSPAGAVPVGLPPAAAGFVGREREMAALDRMLADREQGSAHLIAAVTGPAGVGKSALAVTWSHRVAHTFPDGALHARLRGFDSESAPLSPGEVLTGFLKKLGVAADGIPIDVDDRAALYRSLLSGRRVLVLLDDARDADQVRPLLPGSPGAVVVVTSRRRLDGLVVRSGARALPLETLPTESAVELLDRAGVPGRAAAEPAAARRLAHLCGRLPLALRIAAARLAANPGRAVGELVGELTDERNRLHGLEIDESDTSVRRAFDASYNNLHPTHAHAFRLLGLVPGHTFTPHAVAALCGTDPDTARRRLRALGLAHLVTEPEPDRFALHDLLRVYARDLVASRADSGDASAALVRLRDHYMAVADHARRFLRPARDELDFAGTHAVLPAISGRTEALAWFDAEWPNLVAAITAAHRDGSHTATWRLVRLQFNYLMVRCPWEDWISIYSSGLDSAHRSRDGVGQLLMSAGLGVVHARSGSPETALRHYADSYDGAVAAGDPGYLTMAQVNMSSALIRLGRHPEARRHCEDALGTNRTSGDRYREAGALNNLAQVEQAHGDPDAALGHLRDAASMYREADDLEILAMVLNNCGEVCVELGREGDAQRYHQEALEVARRCGSAMRQAAAHLGLGDVACSRGDDRVARTRWETALSIFDTGRSPRAQEVRTRLAPLR